MGELSKNPRSAAGFTLMELMIVLSVAAVVLALGAPNFTEFSRNNRLTAAANDLLTAAQLARTEAIKRQRNVSLCTSDNVESAAPTCSNTSFRGWIVFQDDNGNCQRDGAEPLPLRVSDSLAPSVHAAQDQHCSTFGPTGYVRGADGLPPISHVLYCDSRGVGLQQGTNQSAARGLSMSPTGRASVTRVQATIVAWGIGCGGA